MAWSILSHDDVSVYLGKQRGKCPPLKEQARGFDLVSAPSAGVLNICDLLLLIQNERTCVQNVSFLPPIGRHVGNDFLGPGRPSFGLK